jgi:hypothetical protein
MKASFFDEIPLLSPEQVAKEKQIEPKGYQYYRDIILRTLSNLTFSEKYKIIKKVDKELLANFNMYQGTKAVHTLDYMCKIPSRKKKLNKKDEIILLLRSLNIVCEKNNYYKLRGNQNVKIIK